jgi:hypothetical protein
VLEAAAAADEATADKAAADGGRGGGGDGTLIPKRGRVALRLALTIDQERRQGSVDIVARRAGALHKAAAFAQLRSAFSRRHYARRRPHPPPDEKFERQ